MLKKFLIALVFLTALTNFAHGAETQEVATDYVTNIQNEISNDISRLRKTINEELAEIDLSKENIDARILELANLTESASDDMAIWGYNDEQRENHLRVLSELSLSLVSYSSLIQGSRQGIETAGLDIKSQDVSDLAAMTSPDINAQDDLRREISKVSRGIVTQVFYLQSKLSKLRSNLDEAAKLKKQLKEAEAGDTGLKTPRTHILELENARLNVALSQIQVRDLKRTFDANVDNIKRLRRRLENMTSILIFPQEVLDANIEKLQTRINELTEELNKARKSLDSANLALARTRAVMTSKDETSQELTVNYANFQARSARVNYWEYLLSFIEEEINYSREAQQIWRDRFKLFHDKATGEEIWKLRDSSEKQVQDLQRQLEGIRSLEASILRQIENTQAQANTEGISSNVQQILLQALDNQRKIVSDVLNRYEALIPNVIFLEQRLNAEANDNISALRVVEKVSNFSRETVLGFFNTQLWEGEGYSVTVWRLIVAILVFLSSFFLSSWGSNLLKRRILKRANANVTAANAVQRILFYILWVAFALIALNIVEIPLTAFAFMGGAMAVGLGFGMQNIFNNLISGFIVIFSRPFKVNDIIEVAGASGKVEDIGSRSTRIKTWDGFDVVLPNRYFLENSVTNWTGSDMKKRELLKVGVAYNSDTRKVEELLNDIVKGHSKILKDPAPMVIFKNFGESALEFEIYYWIDLKQAAGIKVSSDLRHHIASVFNREGIEIPFPQRVVHTRNYEPPKIEEDENQKADVEEEAVKLPK